MNKHLTYDDRLEIQAGLKKRMSFTAIGEAIGKNRTTVCREILAHRKLVLPDSGNRCIHRLECYQARVCGSRCRAASYKTCKTSCGECNRFCRNFVEDICKKYEKLPYVCNGCGSRSRCYRKKMLYDAKVAQEEYEWNFSDSHKGISISEEDLDFLDRVVSPAIRQGQSIPVIWEQYKDEMPVSVKTIYSYIDMGLLSADNLDLRLKLRRPERKKSGPALKVDRAFCVGRTYSDYLQYLEENPDATVVQMDSVLGNKGGKVLLTLFFTNCDLQLMYLRDRNTAASVTYIFHRLRRILGKQSFCNLFPVILTDRGSEFSDPTNIEVDVTTGEILCRVFYCDPMNSNQKSNCERNHEFIRYIIPKGFSMDRYSPEQIRLMMNHINSYPRKKWNGRAPIDLFLEIYGQETAGLLGLERIPPEEVKLIPKLLR